VSGRRRSSRHDRGPRLTTIWWRDIPVQVVADGPEGTVRTELGRRFTAAADAAAMHAGLAGGDDYLEHWDRRSRPCGDDLQAAVAAEVDRLVAAHPQPRLQALVRCGGVAPADGVADVPDGPPDVPDGPPHPDPAAARNPS